VAGFPAILMIMVLAMNWGRLVSANDFGITAAIGYTGFTLGFLAAVFGVVSAIRGWAGAVRQGRSAAWAVHGLLLSALAVLVWGIALFGWHRCIDDARNIRPVPVRIEMVR